MKKIFEQRKPLKYKIIRMILTLLIIALCIPFISHYWISSITKNRIYSEIQKVPDERVALVLGCRVRPGGKPSISLRDRVGTAVRLYKAGKIKKILMSGDNRFEYYNEPQVMRDYAIKLGVPARDIVLDYAGRRTYDSIYRAKHIFGLNSFIIISQNYHLPRALFLSDHLGVKTYGLAGSYEGRSRDRYREIPASVEAIIDIFIRAPKPVMGHKEKI